MTALKLRGGEPRADDTATPPRYDVPVSRVDNHLDTRGPFHRVVCTCGDASPEITDPEDAERAKANHDLRHADELAVAS